MRSVRFSADDYARFLDEIEGEYAGVWSRLPAGVKRTLAAGGFEGVKRVTDKVLAQGRPPRIYLLGRQNVGKSSLVNALTGQSKAKVTALRPQRAATPPYMLDLGDAKWEIYDRDGFDEAIGTDGGKPNLKKIEDLAKDVRQVRPDVLLFLVDGANPGAIRSDLDAFRRIRRVAASAAATDARTIAVLTKVDLVAGAQFVELFPDKLESSSRSARDCQSHIEESLQIFKAAVGAETVRNIKKRPFVGLQVGGSTGQTPIRAIVPVVVASEARVRKRQWNVQTLRDVIVDVLPQEAQRDFARGVNDPRTYRAVADRLRRWFVLAAGTVAAVELDKLLYEPMRDLAVGTVAGLAGRPMTLETVKAFVKATSTRQSKEWPAIGRVKKWLGKAASPIGKVAAGLKSRVGRKGAQKASAASVGAATGTAAKTAARVKPAAIRAFVALKLIDAAVAARRMDSDLQRSIRFYFDGAKTGPRQ